MVAESRGLLVHLFLWFLRNLAEYQLYRRVFKLLCHLLVCARAYIVHAQSNLISDNAYRAKSIRPRYGDAAADRIRRTLSGYTHAMMPGLAIIHLYSRWLQSIVARGPVRQASLRR